MCHYVFCRYVYCVKLSCFVHKIHLAHILKIEPSKFINNV